MAGIGFVLRKLSRKDDITGVLAALMHSALASTGPWLFTVLALGTVMYIGSFFVPFRMIEEFRLIIIYNFCFSLVFSGPIFMVATRFLADRIHAEDTSNAPAMLMGMLIILLGYSFPIVGWFYLGYADLHIGIAVLAIINFMLISSIWLTAVFISSLKDFKTITHTFGFGFVIAIIVTVASTVIVPEEFYSFGMLAGFSLGLFYILASLIAHIIAEYPYPYTAPFRFLEYFKKYWELVVSGFLYNTGVWVDKWIMWFAPEAEMAPSNLIYYSNYDTAMFMAFLTIVPSLAVFVFSVETNFFDHYLRFYREIQRHATFKRILHNHKRMITSILSSARNFIVIQGGICFLAILSAPYIFPYIGINALQIGIFRFGTLGALFHVLIIFLTIVLSYFDHRKMVMGIYLMLFVTNTVFTYYSMQAGFPYYGYGYFLACISTFFVAAILTALYIRKIPYHTFISRNLSIQR